MSELNEQVATQVMGWVLTDERPADAKNWPHPPYPDKWYRRPDGLIVNASTIPSYSTNIGEAWHVIERLNEINYPAQAQFLYYIHTLEDVISPWFLPKEKAARTICKAALKAVKLARMTYE